MKLPRIALFSDSYHEANGIARTAVAIEACARRRNIPLLSVHPGPETRLVHDGSIVRLDLARSGLCSFGLEHGLRFDPAMWRHAGRAAEIVEWFAPDVLHFTGPGDVGQLGAYLGHRLSIPMVASWHTNLHECASRRLRLGWAGTATRDNVEGLGRAADATVAAALLQDSTRRARAQCRACRQCSRRAHRQTDVPHVERREHRSVHARPPKGHEHHRQYRLRRTAVAGEERAPDARGRISSWIRKDSTCDSRLVGDGSERGVASSEHVARRIHGCPARRGAGRRVRPDGHLRVSIRNRHCRQCSARVDGIWSARRRDGGRRPAVRGRDRANGHRRGRSRGVRSGRSSARQRSAAARGDGRCCAGTCPGAAFVGSDLHRHVCGV